MGREKIGYKVFLFGDSMQIIELEIDPGCRIPARAAFDNWIDESVTFEKQAINNGQSAGGVLEKFLNLGKSKLRDHHPVTVFTNSGSARKRIALAAPAERQILPIPISEGDGNFFCHKDAFVCTEPGIELVARSNIRNNISFGGSEKFNWLEFRGDGTIFVHVGGLFKNKKLMNQSLKLDRRSIIGFTSGIRCDRVLSAASAIKKSSDKAYFKGKLSGYGTIYLQSKPYNMPNRTHSMTRDIRDLANSKARQLYNGNLQKIKNFQWSRLQGLVKTDHLKKLFQK
jgi:uncharacterized protein (AIM24 family)